MALYIRRYGHGRKKGIAKVLSRTLDEGIIMFKHTLIQATV
jgi:hypothetical protein